MKRIRLEYAGFSEVAAIVANSVLHVPQHDVSQTVSQSVSQACVVCGALHVGLLLGEAVVLELAPDGLQQLAHTRPVLLLDTQEHTALEMMYLNTVAENSRGVGTVE